jgi:hypothetical protein
LSCNKIHQNLSAAGAAEALALHAPKLQNFNMSDNKLRGEELSVIAKALGSRSMLKHIDLSGNNSDSSACLSICESLKSLKNLESLVLDNGGEMMPECVASITFLRKFPPPPAELVALRSWIELVRFMNIGNCWNRSAVMQVPAIACDHENAFDSDTHCETNEEDDVSTTEGSSCEQSGSDVDSSSSDDDSGAEWEDFESSGLSEGADSDSKIGSKRLPSDRQQRQ